MNTTQQVPERPWRVGLAAIALALALAGAWLEMPWARTALLSWSAFLAALVTVYTALVVSSRASLANEGERLLRTRTDRRAELVANMLRGATIAVLVLSGQQLAAVLLALAIGVAGLVGCIARDAYRATLGSPGQP